MSKKQETIINGTNVSECSYYNKDNEPYCCEVWDNECEAQNCYFKQFKRLQKENEGLKSFNDFNVQKIEVLQKENEKLYKALEEIRKEYTNSIFYQCDKTEEECPCHNCIILGQLDRVQNIVKIIDEALNDRD